MNKSICITILIIACILITKVVVTQNEQTHNNENIKVLLIANNNFGSSYVYDDENIKSIKSQFESFGWNLTLAALTDTVVPCEWGEQTLGTKPMAVANKISELNNPTQFDAIILLPGNEFSNLLNNTVFLNLLKEANQEKIIIAAWCRAVRLLAAADIVEGKNIIGHFDYFDEYKAAGANYIEYSFTWKDGEKIFNNVSPPIQDGNIITTVRSLYYRNEMCELIKKTVEEKRH